MEEVKNTEQDYIGAIRNLSNHVEKLLTDLEVSLNLPSSNKHETFDTRKSAILQRIKELSNVAHYVRTQYSYLLNELADYLEVIEIDFSKFEDDPDAYEQGWEEWKKQYYSRPGMRRSRETK